MDMADAHARIDGFDWLSRHGAPRAISLMIPICKRACTGGKRRAHWSFRTLELSYWHENE
jgi:hypothetical protein